MNAVPLPVTPAPRWPFSVPNVTVFIDYSRGAPGVMSYTDLTETDPITGEIRRITAQPSQVIPDGLSLAYPSQALLYAHVVHIGWHKQKLAEFEQVPPQPQTTVERPVKAGGNRRAWERAARKTELANATLFDR